MSGTQAMDHNGRNSNLAESSHGPVNANETRPPSSVMSLKQAANYLQVSKAHLSNVLNCKVVGVRPIRFVRIGRRILIRREWIDAWLETIDRD